MTSRALSVNEMLKYEAVMEKYESQIFALGNINGIGIGYLHDEQTGKLTSEIGLIVITNPKYDRENTTARSQVKAQYGWLKTQAVEMPEIRHESARKTIPYRNRFQVVDPIVGGVEIGNSKLCRFKSGVLGAIVFDKISGAPLGLSVQHAIGDLNTDKSDGCKCDVCAKAKLEKKGNKKSWWVPAAKKNDPISQPNSFDSKNQIGTLLKFDKKYDAAIFKLNTGDNARKIEASVNGLPGEVNEPTKPTLGRKCLFRGAKTHTEGRIWFVGKLRGEIRRQICFEVTGKNKTAGGDSGGLWVTEDGLHPIGLHTGQTSGTGYAVATCIQQLISEFHPFSFRPVKYDKLIQQVGSYNTTYVDAPDGNGLFTFSCTTTGADPLKIQKYNDIARPVGRPKFKADVDALNGVSASVLGSKVYVAWRSMTGNEIKIGRWNNSGNRETFYGLASYKTIFKPVLQHHRNRLFMAYVDQTSMRTRLLVSDGNNWNICWHSKGSQRKFFSFGNKCAAATALASHKNRLFMAWVGQNDGRINLMEIAPTLSVSEFHRASRVIRSKKLPAQFAPKGDIDLAVSTSTNELVVAMTVAGGALQTLAIPIHGDWTNKSWKPFDVIQNSGLTENAPSLFCHDGRMICTREGAS